MIVILFRMFILFAVVFLIYAVYKYMINPKRKLEAAHEKKQFYFLDDPENVKKNFFMTYKGMMFEGEKYLGTTDQAFHVVTVNVWTHHSDRLTGITKDDIYFLEKEILIRYPHAKVEWKYPIKQLLE
ncbi:hypothetical protein EDD68_104104 [Melghiribacillus thermohalophilus]|uniref:Sigma-w pathway protein ysdB n=1 Tax=Melghiribacillus thermohalophilus TaxID=1324956 RepID=A0A4R3N8E6_9BACI|nr:sigma-w pathway protein ysdB [Melghiribacillus thermohalophilus]TCT25034.1 hypothetical protein EDD68_104104 [Melghiribacillus thermohalophilus]